MHHATSLFDALPHAAAKSDPAPSHAAARQGTADGTRAKNIGKLARLCESMPGRTTFELSMTQQARDLGLSRVEIARRASDAERVGLIRRGEIRKCRVSGKSATTWFATDNGDNTHDAGGQS